jgi:quercetin dioxygenase-like cupin family protein
MTLIAPPTTFWFLDTRVGVLSHRPGEHVLLELSAHPGDTVPLHRHDEDEVFTVLEGTLELLVDGVPSLLPAGSSATAPRDVPHAYRVTADGPARWLVLTTPGSFGDFVSAMARPAETDGLPAPSGPPTPEQAQGLTEVAALHGIEILGPASF